MTTTPKELLALADEIEGSVGLIRMMPGRRHTRSLGIKKTAQVIAGLRLAAKPANEGVQAQFVRQELGGALVFTVLENDHSIVEVVDHLNGTYGLTVHSRSESRDQWDDITATLKPQHFAKLGLVALSTTGEPKP